MVIFTYYDEKNLLDKVWYESSNIIYSECYDKPNDYKELKVVFKSGATYLYKDIDVNDYVTFKFGGIDGSNGRALNEFIKKKKYEYERIENIDLKALQEELERLQAERLAQQQSQKEEKKETQEENVEKSEEPLIPKEVENKENTTE